MRRKVVEQGGLTLMVSLPRKWTKLHKIKKGDEVDISESNGDLQISTETKAEAKRISLNVTGICVAVFFKTLFSAYTQGYDEIEVLFDEPEIMNYKKGKKESVVEKINYVANELIGFEIVEQKESRWLLKDLGGIKEKEFESVLRRTFLLMNNLAEEFVAGDPSTLAEFRTRQDVINKFIRYCKRIVTKQNESHLLYSLLNNLLALTDVVAWLGELSVQKGGYHKGTRPLILEVKSLWLDFYDLYYSHDQEKMNSLVKRRRTCYTYLNAMRSKYPQESQLFGNLSKIIDIIYNLLSVRISLSLESA